MLSVSNKKILKMQILKMLTQNQNNPPKTGISK
jgi:hypothetical protein